MSSKFDRRFSALVKDKISDHIPQDQEHAATLSVHMKILAYPIGKVYGAEHFDRVRGLGGNV
ncbi:hypothetical protein RND71_005709 [Anisodus tanguticus]|uniref:Uncharacterized protein n=1 Tax=Anisodus tanguticus TaxID=243964 RepID=A0AAE1STN4_9SOLA|nr:hypothetical protein RND71_005709 [Anisodus tanguticus]